MNISYSQYLKALKIHNVTTPCYKVEILDAAEIPRYTITDDIATGGSINVKINNGIRRTATLTIINKNNKYRVKPGELFYGTKLRLYAGIQVEEQQYYESLGIFYIQEISPRRSPNNNTIVLSLVDKWGKLDGTIFGKLSDRVEFNKTVVVYKNSNIVRQSGVSSSAIFFSELENNSNKFIISKNFNLGSAMFEEATKGVNNSLTFVAYTEEAPSVKFKFPLSSFMLCFTGDLNNSKSVDNILNIKLNDSLIPSENVKISFYKDPSSQRPVVAFNGEVFDLLSILEDNNKKEEADFIIKQGGNPLVTNKKIVISYYSNNISVLYDDITIFVRNIELPDNFYLYFFEENTEKEINRGQLVIRNLYMDDTSYKEYFDYNIYEIIKTILKKNNRYDLKNISYLPSYLNMNSTSKEINQWLYLKLGDLRDIVPNRDCVTTTKDMLIFKCIANETEPVWEPYYIDLSEIIDNVEPILDSYYEPLYFIKDKNGNYFNSTFEKATHVKVYDNYYLKENLPYGLLSLPRSIIEERGSTESSILGDLADLLSAEVGYNRYGQFFLKPTSREIKYEEQEVIWRFAYRDYYFNQQEEINYSNLINYVVVTSSVIDGGELAAYSVNENPESEYCVQKIGAIPYIYKSSYTYDPNEWIPEGAEDKTEEERRELAINSIKQNMKELADWYLQRNELLQSSVTISCYLIPHLEEGKIIELENEEGIFNKYLINSFAMPIDYSGVMTINCTKVG